MPTETAGCALRDGFEDAGSLRRFRHSHKRDARPQHATAAENERLPLLN